MEDDQQFCLRWNNHQSTLISVFDTLLENGTLVDCTLAAEGRFLKAHKVVLSACSPYFATLLSQQYDKHPIFILKDVKYQELKAMMDYMYRGEVNISQDQLAALLKAAESLQIKGLSDNRRGGGGGGNSGSGNSANQAGEDNTQRHVPVAQTTTQQQPPQQQQQPGYTIEQRRPLKHTTNDTEVIDSREGSASPTSKRRKRIRRRSIYENNVVLDNHELSNSSSQSMAHPVTSTPLATATSSQLNSATSGGATTSVAGVSSGASSAAVAAAVTTAVAVGATTSGGSPYVMNVTKKTDTNIIHDTNSEIDNAQDSDRDDDASNTTNTTMSQHHHQQPTHHPQQSQTHIRLKKQEMDLTNSKDKMDPHSELLIEPKSEYDDGNDEPVEDLTLDDEELLEDLDQAGPSHGGEGSSQGYAQWQVERSQDEVYMSSQDGSGQHRDAQEIIHETKASLRIPNNIVIKNIIPIKSECSSANIFLTPISSTTSIITSAGTTIFTIVTAATSSVTGTPTIFLQTSPSSKFDTKPIIYDTSNIPLSANILPVTMTPIITTSIAVTTSTTITTLTPAIATMTSMITPTTKSTILSTAAALNVTTASTTVLSQSQPPPPSLLSSTQQLQSTSMGIITKSHPRIKYSGIKGGCTEKIEELLPTTHITTSTIPFTTTSIQQPQLITLQSSYTQQALLPPSTFLPTQLQSLVFSSTALKPFVTLTGDGILSHQQTTDNNNIIVPIILPNTKNNVPMSNISVIPSNVTNTSARHHHVQHIQTIQSTTGAPVTNASSIISVPIGVSQQQQQQQQQSSPVIVTDFGSIKYADIDDIELPDGTKIGYPTKLETKCIQPLSTSQDSPIIQLHHHHQQQQESPHPHSLIQIQHDTTGTSGGGIVYTSLAEKYSIIAASALKNFDFTLAETTIKDNTNSNCSSNSNTSAISNNPIKIITSTSTSITTTTSTTTFNNTRSTNTTTATTTTTTTTTTTNSTSGGNNDILIDTTDDPTELYACSYCDKKYRWKSTLRRHENDECGGKEPAHQCPYCPYKAKQRGNLGVHVRKHHGDMPQLESKRKKRGSSI